MKNKFKKTLLQLLRRRMVFAIKFVNKNRNLAIISFIYSILMVSIIKWGIPNSNHPFNYHMDEWHQLQAIRAVFEYGSPNIEGAANGTLFQFLLSGMYLAPFVLLKILDPFVIKSPLIAFEMQERLFILLRLNTLIFGVLSLIVLNNLIKKYFKVSPIFSLLFFSVTPIWFSLSNYFKYDIALIFWILASMYLLLKFSINPTLKNYIVAGIFCGLAIATKISAVPLFVIYIFSFLYFYPDPLKNIRKLLIGFTIFIITILVFGIPDLFFLRGSYYEYLFSNLVRDHTIFDNLILDINPWWVYVIIKVLPLNFGYLFFIFFLVVFGLSCLKTIKQIIKKKLEKANKELFLFISLLIFIISLIPLGLGANGNRLLVLLPFFAILSGLFVQKLKNKYPHYNSFLNLVFILLIFIQFMQSIIMIWYKWQPDIRQVSSFWIKNNIFKGTIIGIENIPIYQLLPDVVLFEYYLSQYNEGAQTLYSYDIVDTSSKRLPDVIIITDKEYAMYYLKTSPKKSLLARLKAEKYKIVREFRPPNLLYRGMGGELGFHTSGLVPVQTITIFRKDKK